MSALFIQILSPSETIYAGDVDMVNLPGTKGLLGVLPGHSKFISNLNIGIITIWYKNIKMEYFIEEGMAQIHYFKLNIIGSFIINIKNNSKKSIFKKVKQLQNNLSNIKNNTIDKKNIQQQIKRYQSLLNFL
jgi:F-type H+-transporting ATPase subunit epsilon